MLLDKIMQIYYFHSGFASSILLIFKACAHLAKLESFINSEIQIPNIFTIFAKNAILIL